MTVQRGDPPRPCQVQQRPSFLVMFPGDARNSRQGSKVQQLLQKQTRSFAWSGARTSRIRSTWRQKFRIDLAESFIFIPDFRELNLQGL
jgi:hypothetical protein